MKKPIITMAVVACIFAACTNSVKTTGTATESSSSTQTKNKQTALNNVQAYAKQDVDAVFRDYATDFVEYGNGEMKPMKNQDSMKLDLKNFFAAFPNYKGVTTKTVADSNTVVVISDWSGTFKKEYMKVKPTGKSFKTTDADIFTFNDAGKITSHKAVQSLATIFYQLGIPPMPAKKN